MLTKAELGAAIEAARKAKGITKKALAERFGVKPPSVQDWVKNGTIEQQRLLELIEFFSDVVGPEHWGLTNWQNTQHPTEGSPVYLAREMSHQRTYSGRPTTERVPVTGTLEMAEGDRMKVLRAATGQALGYVESPLTLPGTYAVRVVGDWLYPTARHGACLVIEPTGQCNGGELVLLTRPDGTVDVAELVAARADSVTIVPANGGQRVTLARGAVESVQPIVAVVAGSKFRAAAEPLPTPSSR